jgi:hypothetical protein
MRDEKDEGRQELSRLGSKFTEIKEGETLNGSSRAFFSHHQLCTFSVYSKTEENELQEKDDRVHDEEEFA